MLLELQNIALAVWYWADPHRVCDRVLVFRRRCCSLDPHTAPPPPCLAQSPATPDRAVGATGTIRCHRGWRRALVMQPWWGSLDAYTPIVC
jgi:hypothetical protein